LKKITPDDITKNKPAYFNSQPKIVINLNDIELSLANQEILNKIQSWISEGSGWLIKSVDAQYINIVKYEPLKGSSYIELPRGLKNPSKGLINLKNKDNECFRWCHIRHLNPQNKDPQSIKKIDKQCVPQLDYTGIEFPVSNKQYNKVEKQNSINVNVFGYESQ